MILRGRGRSAVADAPFRPRESQVRTRAQVIGRRGARGPPRSTGAGEDVLSQADPRRWHPPGPGDLRGQDSVGLSRFRHILEPVTDNANVIGGHEFRGEPWIVPAKDRKIPVL